MKWLSTITTGNSEIVRTPINWSRRKPCISELRDSIRSAFIIIIKHLGQGQKGLQKRRFYMNIVDSDLRSIGYKGIKKSLHNH